MMSGPLFGYIAVAKDIDDRLIDWIVMPKLMMLGNVYCVALALAVSRLAVASSPIYLIHGLD